MDTPLISLGWTPRRGERPAGAAGPPHPPTSTTVLPTRDTAASLTGATLTGTEGDFGTASVCISLTSNDAEPLPRACLSVCMSSLVKSLKISCPFFQNEVFILNRRCCGYESFVAYGLQILPLVLELIFIFLFGLLFLSNLHIQRGTQTHNPRWTVVRSTNGASRAPAFTLQQRLSKNRN